MNPRLDPKGLLVGAMLGAAIANFVQFPSIERGIGSTYNAISVYENGSMAVIAIGHSPTVRERFGLETQIGVLAPGATVDLGGFDALRAEGLYALGRASEVVDRGTSPAPRQLALVEAEAVVSVAGTDRELGPYTIALGAQPRELRFLSADGRLWVVDTELLRLVDSEVGG